MRDLKDNFILGISNTYEVRLNIIVIRKPQQNLENSENWNFEILKFY